MNFNYDHLSAAFDSKFLGSLADSDALAVRPQNSYGTRFVIGEFSIHNRSGGVAVCGIGGRIQSSIWTAGFWTDASYAAGTVYADDTADAQDAGGGTINLATVATANDGFLIGCDIPFNIVGLSVSQAAASGAIWEVRYSIASLGTGLDNNYTALTNTYVAPSFGAIGEQVIWFEPPMDWAKATTASAVINRHGATVPRQYLLLVRATTAPDTTRGAATQVQVGRIFMSTEFVGDNNVLSNIGGTEIFLPPQCDAICSAISTANPQNRCDLSWRYAG